MDGNIIKWTNFLNGYLKENVFMYQLEGLVMNRKDNKNMQTHQILVWLETSTMSFV